MVDWQRQVRRGVGGVLLALGALGAVAPVLHAAAVRSDQSVSHVEAPADRVCEPVHDAFGCPVCQSFRLPALVSSAVPCADREASACGPEASRDAGCVPAPGEAPGARSPPC